MLVEDVKICATKRSNRSKSNDLMRSQRFQDLNNEPLSLEKRPENADS